MSDKDLPKASSKKKINIEKFKVLAEKVKKHFEEEADYLEKKAPKDENNNSTRFLANS